MEAILKTEYDSKIQAVVESLFMDKAELKILGTAFSVDGRDINISIDGDKADISMSLKKIHRNDVLKVYSVLGRDYKAGYRIVIKSSHLRRLLPINVIYSDKENTAAICITEDILYKYAKTDTNIMTKYIRKTIEVFREEGFSEVVKKVKKKLKKHRDVSYNKWIKRNEPKAEELKRQVDLSKKMSNPPTVSVVVPLYNTPIKLLKEMIKSVQNQTYPYWELVLADGSGDDRLETAVKNISGMDKRVVYKALMENNGISENTNAALRIAKGELIAFMDHDDTLSMDALYEVACAYINDDNADIIYSDQDKISMDGKVRYEVMFKSDFDLDFMCTCNYINHLFVVKRDLIEKVGYLNEEYDGAQDYDFMLRCIEHSKNIVHIPKVLYHWRSTPNSVASDELAKGYAFVNGKRAIQAHYDREGKCRCEVEMTDIPGNYRTRRYWDRLSGDDKPLVSVIIPNKDHISELDVAIGSLREQNYDRLEIIVVENNSNEAETFEYYKKLTEDERIKVIEYSGDFNFSDINNFGVNHANGEYLLLLNNDTKMIGENVIEEMLSHALRDEVGAVGARLFYEDDSIQHAGVLLGYGGIAGHAFLEADKNDPGYENRIVSVHEASAVTAACMMVRASIYNAVGGMNTKLAVAFNDIDLCMRIRKAGYLIIYDAYAMLYHFESKTRGYDDDDESKTIRIKREIKVFKDIWHEELKKGDPYYNVNLNLDLDYPTYKIAY